MIQPSPLYTAVLDDTLIITVHVAVVPGAIAALLVLILLISCCMLLAATIVQRKNIPLYMVQVR